MVVVRIVSAWGMQGSEPDSSSSQITTISVSCYLVEQCPRAKVSIPVVSPFPPCHLR